MTRRRRGCWAAPLLAGVVSAGEAVAVPAADPVVRVLVFEAPECGHCRAVRDTVLAPLEAAYGARFEVGTLNVRDPDAYRILLALEARHDAGRATELPVVALGGRLLSGPREVSRALPGLVAERLPRGAPWPAVEGLAALLEDAPEPRAAPPSLFLEDCDDEDCRLGPPIRALYVYQVGCQACSRAEADIAVVQRAQPRLVVDRRNVYEHAALAQWMVRRADREALVTPALFVGDEALLGEDELTASRLSSLVARHEANGAPATWERFSDGEGRRDLRARFRSLGPLAVVMAGLVDGVNPCAFATIIFFVSYLAVARRRGREILAVGAAFTAGVFLAYLAVGLGLHRLLDLMGDLLTTLGRWVTALTAVLCAALAVAAVYDWAKARRGQLEDMALALPHPLRMRINATIRKSARARTFVWAAFLAGLVVSLLELACTGQVYLPTIVFVTTVPELRPRAITYLVLYNVMFVVPLIAVFILAYLGTTSDQLTDWLKARAPRVKLGMAALFATLAVWLGVSLI